MTLNLEKLKDDNIEYLEKFTKDNFDVELIKIFAREKKYSDLIKNYFKAELENPSDKFIDFLNKEINFRKLNKDKIKELVSSSFMGASTNLVPTHNKINTDMEEGPFLLRSK